MYNRFKDVPSVYIDGTLYMIIAVCGFLASQFGSDEAYKLFTETMLFWAKLVNGTLLAGATALKMFRSTGFAEHVQNKVNNPNEDPSKPIVPQLNPNP